LVAGPTEISGRRASALPVDTATRFRSEQQRNAARAARRTMLGLPPALTESMVRAPRRECRHPNLQKN
jgi:hypothetical protein